MRGRGVRSGTLFVFALAACMAGGWLLYQPYLPAKWLHDFSGEIAARAAPDPTPPEPEDVRQAQRRAPPDHPYICAADFIDLDWDRMIIVAGGQDISVHPTLSKVSWERMADVAARTGEDRRYQLIVLLRGQTVVDAQLFYTFWGDLSALVRPEGYTRDEAVFTAASNDGIYYVSPAPAVPPGFCRSRKAPS